MKQYLVMGSYTEAILFGTGEVYQGKGKGVTICSFEEGEIEVIEELAIPNPSFVCVDESRKRIYAVNELKEYLGSEGGGVTELSYDDDLGLTVEGTWCTGGKDPCHVAVSPGKDLIAIANYSSGSVTTFGLDGDGNIIGEGRNLFQHEGSSVHPERQTEPHAHSCIFAGELLYVADLGLDRIVAYDLPGGKIVPNTSLGVTVPAGNGPRYGEFSSDGRFFYLVNELSSQVIVYRHADERLEELQAVSTLPEDFTGESTCADLHLTPDGKRLYASNRGHDSITGYRVEEDGSLSFISCQPCGGRTPRNFAIDPAGEYLLVGNQDSDTVSVFRIEEDGTLAMVNQVETGSPVCIRFFQPTSG